ncbi:MAG: DUF420 domain-containing protein [Akkermansiaceae bacterium]
MTTSEEKSEWLRREPKETLAKLLGITSWIVTGLVLVLVGLMRRPELRIELPDGIDFSFLPPIHALLNTGVAILLIAAVIAVKKGNIRAHRGFMLGAMGMSVVFLLGYVAYHFTNFETLYGDLNKDSILDATELEAVGSMRSLYLVILITHIIAAGVSLPLILLTFTAAWTNQFRKHRSMARWVFPIWLFVAVTGPICYLMLRPYY